MTQENQQQTPSVASFGLPRVPLAPWQRYYNEGWLLAERIDLMRAFHQPPIARNVLMGLLVLAAVSFPVFAMNYGAKASSWIASMFLPSVKAAPALYPITPVVDPSRMGSTPEAQYAYVEGLASPEVAGQYLAGEMAKFKGDEAKLIDGCKPWKLATQAAPTAKDMTWHTGDTNDIGCRLSADKSRLWVWGLVKGVNRYGQLGEPVPILSVLRYGPAQTKEPTWTAYAVEANGLARLPGLPVIGVDSIPRALAEDFPELLISTNAGAGVVH